MNYECIKSDGRGLERNIENTKGSEGCRVRNRKKTRMKPVRFNLTYVHEGFVICVVDKWDQTGFHERVRIMDLKEGKCYKFIVQELR